MTHANAKLPSAELTCWPQVGLDFQVQGAIANLPACTRIVLAGLDPWTELPVLALWLRKAAVRGVESSLKVFPELQG